MNSLHVFHENGHIFTSKDSSILPPIPPLQFLGQDCLPSQAQELRWATNFYPQITFVPSRPNFNSTLFRCLAGSFAIEQVGSKWQLHCDTQESWYRLELSLKSMANILVSGTFFPLECSFFPLPSSFGYMRQHTMSRIAKRCATTSRSAFVQLAAMCSLGIAIHIAEWELNSPNPKWITLLTEQGVHPVWIDNFRNTQYADFLNTERVGSIIHPECRWLNLIPAMRRAKVPLWCLWNEGNLEAYAKNPMVSFLTRAECTFRPTEEQIRIAKQSIHIDDSPSVDPSSSGHLILPEPEKFSHQKRGETWQQFFERQRLSHEKWARVETPMQEKARLAREKAAERHMCPGQKGAHVWEWIEIDGFLMRTKVDRKSVAMVWPGFSDTQRRYNGFSDEWDLCHAFDPDGIPDEDYDDESFEYLPHELLTVPLTQIHSTVSLPNRQKALQDSFGVLKDIYDDEYVETPAYCEDHVEDILYYRYGFSHTPGFVDFPVADADAVSYAKKTLAISNDCFLKLDLAAFASFVRALVHKTNPHAALWDLDKANEVALANQDHNGVTIRIFHVRSGTHYVVEARTWSPSWKLVVQSAATAVECLRRHDWTRSRYSLAQNLLARGMPFRTMVPLSIDAGISDRPVYIHRPRQVGYIPDKYDYFEYEYKLKSFLLEQVHARATLLRGGIVWRLAREVIGDRLDQYVVLGPSENVHIFGSPLRLSSIDPPVWDDDLSDAELNFICGVVPIWTGSGVQTQESSWWPKASVFETSPLNVGYWSHACEYWFQSRLKDVRSGVMGTKTPAHWKQSLKLWKPTRNLIEGNERAALNFLIAQ